MKLLKSCCNLPAIANNQDCFYIVLIITDCYESEWAVRFFLRLSNIEITLKNQTKLQQWHLVSDTLLTSLDAGCSIHFLELNDFFVVF